MVIIMSKTAHLMYFLLNTEENRPSWARYLNVSEMSYLALLQNTMDSGVLAQHLKIQDFASPLLNQHFFILFIYFL